YLLADGSRALAGTWDMGSQALTNVNIDSGVITGITDLAVADGGTGASSFTDHGVMLGSGAGALSVTATGTSGQVLTSNGSDANPTFQAGGGGGLTMVTGTYTGDGTTSQEITGLGITPRFVQIVRRETATSQTSEIIYSTDTIVDDNAAGMAITVVSSAITRIDSIIAMASGSFTVDDAGADENPNSNGITYNYIAFGV
ncbi:hypothetical protein LCGC14_2547220, partial [marine sediment metagenome]